MNRLGVKGIKVAKALFIGGLLLLNMYLYATKAVPGALESSIDLRYERARDFLIHQWAGIEEYPSMLCCILPLAAFPTIDAARFGWMKEQGVYDNSRIIIVSPINPFTGEMISDREKYLHPQEVLMGVWWEPDKKASTWGTDKTRWYSVEDNIFVDDNWRVLESVD